MTETKEPAYWSLTDTDGEDIIETDGITAEALAKSMTMDEFDLLLDEMILTWVFLGEPDKDEAFDALCLMLNRVELLVQDEMITRYDE